MQRQPLPDSSSNTFKLSQSATSPANFLSTRAPAEMPPVCYRTPTVGPPAPRVHVPHSDRPPNKPPKSRNLPPVLACRESRAIQGNQTFGVVLEETNTSGWAEEGCCPRGDATSCSNVSPGRSPHRTLKGELAPADRPRRSEGCRWGRYAASKMSSSSWVTQTLHKSGKLHYCQ